MLELQQLSPEQTTVQSGGVTVGIMLQPITLQPIQPQFRASFRFLSKLADRLSTWAEENGLLKQQPTRKPFF